MEIVNPTPFLVARAVHLDKSAAEHLVVALKATFAIGPRGEVSVAEEQDPIRPADEFLDEPGQSSIVRASELEPPKPATDVILRGHALAGRRGTVSMPVQFRVGPVRQEAMVFGRRLWTKKMGFGGISDPEPFEKIQLIWENAFGGTDVSPDDPRHHAREARNPVGRGFRAKNSNLDWVDTPLPSIEDPAGLLTKPGKAAEPIGFGPIGRDWEPRVRYAGTYDEAWIADRMPLLPEDFDERFHNAAPPALIAAGRLGGGEAVEVTGCTPDGKLACRLPRLAVAAAVRFVDRREPVELVWDTVTVDSDARRLHVVWKGSLRVHGELLDLRAIECSVEGETV